MALPPRTPTDEDLALLALAIIEPEDEVYAFELWACDDETGEYDVEKVAAGIGRNPSAKAALMRAWDAARGTAEEVAETLMEPD